MIRRALAVAAVVLGANQALAVPVLPTEVHVVPVYSTPPGIRVSWTQPARAQVYTIYKQLGAGPETVVTALAGPGGDRTHFVDSAIAPVTQYRYRLEACDAEGCVSAPAFTTWVDTVWPISGGRRVLNGFNENIGWAGLRGTDGKPAGFHDGLDLGRTTTGTTPADAVFAPRGGVVTMIKFPPAPSIDDGYVEVRVDTGSMLEFDGFNHIDTSAPLPVMVGDVVVPGQRIATIGTRQFDVSHTAPTAFDDHVHFWVRAPNTWTTARHPLTIFNTDADRDPLGNPPALNDENGDGKQVLYFNHTTGALMPYDPATAPLHGDIDVAAEVTDRQGTKPDQAPLRLGYWIEGPLPASEHLDDVKSAANPYRLYDFRSEYWGKAPATACDLVSAIDDVANYGCRGLKPNGCTVAPGVPCNSVLKEGAIGYLWPVLHHFVVTHAGTEAASRTGLAKTQFWRTAAKDDDGAVGSTHANYAGQPTTTKAWEARFPDGDYDIHVLASDLVHTDVDVKLPTTRLENFAPFVRELLLAVDADDNPATGRPETPGCESEVYDYKHPARRQYPDPFTLVVTRSAAALTAIRGGTSVCVHVRFSEPMTDASVELVRNRGAGSLLANVTGAFQKTHQEKDTWRGTATLAPDPSGNSDSSFANDEKDIAIRVTARDRRDGANVTRSLDSDGDGLPNPSGDVNHLVKVDLSGMEKSVSVIR